MAGARHDLRGYKVRDLILCERRAPNSDRIRPVDVVRSVDNSGSYCILVLLPEGWPGRDPGSRALPHAAILRPLTEWAVRPRCRVASDASLSCSMPEFQERSEASCELDLSSPSHPTSYSSPIADYFRQSRPKHATQFNCEGILSFLLRYQSQPPTTLYHREICCHWLTTLSCDGPQLFRWPM